MEPVSLGGHLGGADWRRWPQQQVALMEMDTSGWDWPAGRPAGNRWAGGANGAPYKMALGDDVRGH